MSKTTKYILTLSGMLLVSLCFQTSFESTTGTMKSSSSQENNNNNRGLEIDHFLDGSSTANTKKQQRRIPIEKGEFFLTDSDTAELPFGIDFVPPGTGSSNDDSYGKLEPLWKCNSSENVNNKTAATMTTDGRSKKLIFVHPVRTAAFLIQDLISSYSSTCHVGFASTAMCSGLSWNSMTTGTWANRIAPGKTKGVRCRLHETKDRSNGGTIQGQQFVESSFLTKHVDALVGQVPLGSHQKWKDNKNKQTASVDAQYVVSLRDPYTWFVSSMIDKTKSNHAQQQKLYDENKEEVREEEKDNEEINVDLVDEIVMAVKEKVKEDLDTDIYHEIYARYLITPYQISWIQKEAADFGVEHRVSLSLRNLMENNVVIVITEEMTESLEKLQYLLNIDNQKEAESVFKRAQKQLQEIQKEEDNNNKKRNSTTPSVETILEKLKEDRVFYESQLSKYLQYETEIYNQAKNMHQKQLAWVRYNKKKQSKTKVVS